MTAESPGAFLQGSTYGAVVVRRALGTLLQRGSSVASIVGGLVGSGDMQVTAGSGMHVEVAPGEAWVPGTSSATQSGYYCRVESSTTLAIAASSETNPRIDTVIAKVIDKAYAGTEETFSVAVVTGTAEAGATLANKKGAAAVPASSMVLAYVLVPAKAVSISGGNIENVAVPVTSSLAALPIVQTPTVSVTARSGETVETGTAGITITLPAVAMNARVGVLYWGGGAGITVKTAAAEVIQGDFTKATSVKLLESQHLQLVSDGSNWFIIAGEPKREQTASVKKAFTKAEAEAETEPSATRPSTVMLETLTSEGHPPHVFAGGVEVLEGSSVATSQNFTVPLNPGQKWKVTSTGAALTGHVSVLLG